MLANGWGRKNKLLTSRGWSKPTTKIGIMEELHLFVDSHRALRFCVLGIVALGDGIPQQSYRETLPRNKIDIDQLSICIMEPEATIAEKSGQIEPQRWDHMTWIMQWSYYSFATSPAQHSTRPSHKTILKTGKFGHCYLPKQTGSLQVERGALWMRLCARSMSERTFATGFQDRHLVYLQEKNPFKKVQRARSSQNNTFHWHLRLGQACTPGCRRKTEPTWHKLKSSQIMYTNIRWTSCNVDPKRCDSHYPSIRFLLKVWVTSSMCSTVPTS